MPSFGQNSEPACILCGESCEIGYAHNRFGTWSLRALICQNKADCGVSYRSIWRSVKLHDMSRFYGSPTLINMCSRVKDLDFNEAKLFGFSAFSEIAVEHEGLERDDLSSLFPPSELYARGWEATYQGNDAEFDVRLIIRASRSRFKRPKDYQKAIIECGDSHLVLPLSGEWLGTTTNLDLFQETILRLMAKISQPIIEGGCLDLGSSLSWSAFAEFDKDLKRLVAPLLVNRDCHEIWVARAADDSLIESKMREVVEHLKDTFDIFEINDLVYQSRIISGKLSFIPRNISNNLGKALVSVFR